MFRILVVEDDPAVRLLVERVLSRHGYRVQTAATAREALAFVLYDVPQVPDLALLDVVLPGMSGVAFADRLRTHFPAIRLLFMTGWHQPSRDHEEARKRGPVLAKPFSIDALLDAVRVGIGNPALSTEQESRPGAP